MYSVLIQSKKTIESFYEFHPLFMDALKENLGVCEWNEDKTDIASALPNLRELTEDKAEWRAIIVRVEDMDPREADPSNPYDFKVNSENYMKNHGVDYSEANPIPLVRLTHMLAGVPRPEKNYVMIDPIKEAQKKRREEERQMLEEAERNGQDTTALQEEFEKRPPIPVENEEGKLILPYYKVERDEEAERLHQILNDKYNFDGKLPAEIIIVTWHVSPKNQWEKATKASWIDRNELESSEFWKRNNYPAACRFLTYEYHEEGHVQREADLFNFWSCVLILANNRIDPSTLQAYRLYTISAELDEKELERTLQTKASHLTGIKNFINEAFEREHRGKTRDDRDLPKYEATISISPIPVKQSDVTVDTRQFHLGRRSEDYEAGKWHAAREKAEAQLDALFRNGERALEESAGFVRRESVRTVAESDGLEDYQRVEIQNNLEDTYANILEQQTTLPDIRMKRKPSVEERAKEVRYGIKTRIDGAVIAMTAVLIALIVVFAWVPSLVFHQALDMGKMPPAAIYAGIFLAVLLLAFLVVLIVQRAIFTHKIKEYNREMKDHIREMHENSSKYGTYTSAIATYTRGTIFLNQSNERKISSGEVYDAYKAHRKEANLVLDRVFAWCEAFHFPVDSNTVLVTSREIDLDVIPEKNPEYSFGEDVDKDVPLNETGYYVKSPVQFVSRLVIDRKEIYEE